MDVDSTLISVLQGQLKDAQAELERQKSINTELDTKLHRKRCQVAELELEIEDMKKAVGQDINLFYNKAKQVIESQFGLGLKMRPGDLVRLWLNFYHLAINFTGSVASERTVYRFEQAAMGLANQMVQQGEIMLEGDQLGSMLERIIYPYITVSTADGEFTWTELREKYR